MKFFDSGYSAAVNYDDLAVHEAVAVGDHEGSVFGQFFGTAQTTARDPELMHLKQALWQSVRKVCVKDSGGDGVDGDAEGGGFARKTFGEAYDGCLRRRVMHGGRQRADSAYGSDVEDCPFALANHLLVDGFGDGEKTVDVRVDDLVPGAVCGRGKVIAAIDGRVVDENIYAAPLFYELACQALHADAIRDGDFEGMCASPVSLNFPYSLFGQIVSDVIVEGYVRALACEDVAERRTDAARAARNESSFPLKQKTQVIVLLQKGPPRTDAAGAIVFDCLVVLKWN